MQLIQLPSQRIINNIFTKNPQIVIIADNVLIIITLPDAPTLRTSEGIDAFGYGRFERTDNCTQ